VGLDSTNNPAASVAGIENPPEDSKEEENFDMIKRYWIDLDVPYSSHDYNPDPIAPVDQFS